MGRTLSLDLRERVAGFVLSGASRRAAALRFGVSTSFAVKLMRRRAQSGSPAPKRQGRPRGGRVSPFEGFLVAEVEKILDNLAVHKSAKAAACLKTRGAWFLFLPPYSLDLNPIEMAFAKLKAHLRKAGARTFDALWKAVGSICNLFSQDECWNFLRAAGYASD